MFTEFARYVVRGLLSVRSATAVRLFLSPAVILGLPLLVSSALAENVLTSNWKFATGDNSSFASPDFDDSKWSAIMSGDKWEDQGYLTYDGYAWYRQTVTIPSSAKVQAQQFGGFALQLGKIDDVDPTFFNGTLIGMMGSFPPSYKTAYDQNRVYIVPVSAIKWDAPNVIAIRVYDFHGSGGLWSGDVSLKARSVLTYIKVAPQGFDGPDRIVSSDAPHGSFDLRNDASAAAELDGTTTVQGPPQFGSSGYYHLTVPGNAQISLLDLSKQSIGPGFYSVFLQVAQFNQIDPQYIQLGFAVDPEKAIVPPDSVPNLQSFWDQSKQDLAVQPPNFQATRAADQPYPAITVYSIVMTSIGNVRVRGWLGVPNAGGKHPGILFLPGFGSSQGTDALDQTGDFVSVAIDVRGQGKSIDDFNPGLTLVEYSGIGSPNTWIERGTTLDCVRALDFLLSRPEVDTTRIAVTGPSQGGGLTYRVAAIDPRVTICAPIVPAYGDYLNFPFYNFETDPTFAANAPGVSLQDAIKVQEFFDNKNLAAFVSCPVYMQVGGEDLNCPPQSGFAIYNNLHVPRKYSYYPDSPHQLPDISVVRRQTWIRQMFGMEGPSAFTLQPESQNIVPGTSIVLKAEVESGPAPTYQWKKNGVVIPGANQPTLSFNSVTSSDAGEYILTASTPAGSLASQPAEISVGAGAPSRIVNLSIRSLAGHNGNPLIAGFIVTGGTKSLLVRGMGPSLRAYGITNFLSDPRMEIHGNTTAGDTIFATNDNWGDGGQASTMAAIFERSGAAAFSDPASKDAALLLDVNGARTALINSASSGQSGVVLAEVFDADHTGAADLSNISARNYVGSGDSVLIAGFVIQGTAPKKLLIRAVGPGLLDFGVTSILSDPVLEIHQTVSGVDHVVASNDDWGTFPQAADTMEQAHVFSLHDGSFDSVVIVTVAPGAYTAIVSGANGSTGEALVEVYELN